MFFRGCFFVFFILFVNLHADIMSTDGLARVHAMRAPAKIELEQYFRQTPQYKFEGQVKGFWGSTYMNAKSVSKPDSDTAVYAMSPDFGKWRFGISYYPDYANGGATEWDDTVAHRYSKTYGVSYNVLSPQISYAITENLFASIGTKTVFGKGYFSAEYASFYSTTMSGSGVGTSFIGAISYRAADFLLLNASTGTKTTVNLKGTIKQTSIKDGDIDMIIPPWYLLNVTVFLDPTLALWISYKEVIKTSPGEINLPLTQAAIDSTLGSLTNPLGDIDVYYAGVGKKMDKHSFALTLGFSEPKINQKSITLSSQPLRTQFAQAIYEYALDSEWSGGLKYTHVKFLEQLVDNSKLSGKFSETSSGAATVFIKKNF